MGEVGPAIRRARAALGWSLAELARRAGCSRSYLSQIENGVNGGEIDATLLARLERHFGFAEGELALMQVMASMPRSAFTRLQSQQSDERRAMSDEARQGLDVTGVKARLWREGVDALYKSGELARLVGAASEAARPRGVVARREQNVPLSDGLARVPLVERVAAGGAAEFGEGELHGPKVAVPQWAEMGQEGPVNGASAAFACVVSGDSMAPTYSAGDLVVFTGAREAKEGEDCYVRFAGGMGEATFKRVRFEGAQEAGGGFVRLIPLNARYEARVYQREQIEAIYPAVWVVRRVGGEQVGR